MNNDLFKPTKLKQLCEKYQLLPSKQYGQNFLISELVIEKIIKAADLKKNDTVVEIGPGFGVLTFAMAPLVKKVIAFEIERRLDEYWQENKPHNVEIIWGDALRNWKLETGNFGKFKVVANLPYQITSQVLRVLLEQENKPESITVMVQKEVAERICAKPGAMSILAVSVQYYGEPKIVTRVSKGNFWPEPTVDSAVVHINTRAQKHESTEAQKHESTEAQKHESTEAHEYGSTGAHEHTNTREHGSMFSDEEFFKVVRAGFANKRKQLWRNLSVGLGMNGELVKKILADVIGNEKVRAQELSVGEWREIVLQVNSK